MKVHVIQASIQWGSPKANIDHIEQHLEGIHNTDLVVLPEMWATGFSMDVHQWGPYRESCLAKMREWSNSLSAAVCGSLITPDRGSYYNRLYFVKHDGPIETYDKRHLFGYADEDKFFTPGRDRLIVDYNGWKICPLICYDLRFPVWSRNKDAYDLLIYCANWPSRRIHAWRTLLVARAIENQSYVIGCNCVGRDNNNNTYNGESHIIAFDGAVLARKGAKDGVIGGDLDREMLMDYRRQLPFLKDSDAFDLH